MDQLIVYIKPEEGLISVKNNGKGIPIKIHKQYKVYVPELIFGQLLTSSNYNDDEKKVVGGRNGYGAKLTNIYSKMFEVETADKRAKKKFRMVWSDNMSKKSEPEISRNDEKEEYTKIIFKPDLSKFGMERLEGDIIALMKKRVYDLAGVISSNVKVYLNGKRIRV